MLYLRDLAVLIAACAGLGCSSEVDSDTPTDTTQPPDPPAVVSAVFHSPETACSDPAVILCEDFETDRQSIWSDYEDNGFVVTANAALSGTSSMEQEYQLGQVSAGWLAWFFGDHPMGGTRTGEHFEEIFFRWYHKFQAGWPQYPPKMARVRSHYIGCDWCFAWAEHFWVHPDGRALSDPMSNIAAPNGTTLASSERWLGATDVDLSFADRGDSWVALEMRIKLNTPGQNDGRLTYWANGEIVLDRQNENLRGAYDGTTINVAMIDTYWNEGAPVAGLRRWYDNVVLATEAIGCAVPTIQKSTLVGQVAWEVEVAVDSPTHPVVWSSGTKAGDASEVQLSDDAGTFASGRSSCVLPDAGLVVRARHRNSIGWSEWTEWASLF
ncbi:MAG: hypothetical protein JSW71_11795 [Gemmatimonadota bacterium]|nr:MAG: hypothetical protein JSW71_11795 [Gemmatimonadota bacterium]